MSLLNQIEPRDTAVLPRHPETLQAQAITWKPCYGFGCEYLDMQALPKHLWGLSSVHQGPHHLDAQRIFLDARTAPLVKHRGFNRHSFGILQEGHHLFKLSHWSQNFPPGVQKIVISRVLFWVPFLDLKMATPSYLT